MSFDYLKKLEIVEDKTAEYEIDLGYPAVLVVKSAATNKAYTNAMIKMASKQRFNRAKAKSEPAEMLEVTRERDRTLYPLHIVVGWKDVVDNDGQPVEFSLEACQDFFKNIPDYMLDGIRTFASIPSNFVEQPDTEELVGN